MTLLLSGLSLACMLQAQTSMQPAGHNPTTKLRVHYKTSPGTPLTLITPDDPHFDEDIETIFPGALNSKDFAAIRPFMVIVRNDSPKVVRAYEIVWHVSPPGATADDPLVERRLHISSITTPLDMRHPGGIWRTDQSILPGEERLLTPTFNGRKEEMVRFATSADASDLPAPDTYSGIRQEVDCVVYGDGSSAGANHSHLLIRYFAVRDAQHDEALTVLRAIRKQPTKAELKSTLEQHQQIGASVTAPNSKLVAIYVHERAIAAQQFETILERGGYNALQARVEDLVVLMPPHDKFTALGGQYHKSQFRVNRRLATPKD